MESKKDQFIDRDLSWLSFNKRILDEAADSSVPVYERIKFLAIYSSNLDEFFRVRVAAIKSLARLGKKKIEKELQFDPKQLLKDIRNEVGNQLELLGQIFREDILLELEKNNITLYYNNSIRSSHKREITTYFKSQVLASIQPKFFAENNELFLENKKLYLVVQLESLDENKNLEFAYLQIPDHLPRFKQLELIDEKHYIIFLDDIIRENLAFIFPGYNVLSCSSIKLNRDQDVALEAKISEDIVNRVKKQLEKRKVGAPTRLLYDGSMSATLVEILAEKLSLKPKEMAKGGRYHNMNDLMELPNPIGSALKAPSLESISLKKLDDYEYLFDAIDHQDRMFHFPYQSYNYILRLFNEAANDPKVTAIRATLYRVAANSTIARALITAAKNGKKVEVFVELKARFDEANNIRWAQKMKDAGVKVTYSFEDLKVHAKVAIFQRDNGESKKLYAFFGTGNFNENTAGIYADHGLLTCRKEMCEELNRVFDFLQHKEEISVPLNHLLVARFNMQQKLLDLIDREIQWVKKGKSGHAIIKLNNLEEETMISKLYEASQAGVKIDLIIRGICRLKPQKKGLSENIRAIRLVDGFLEHARIFKFSNGGNPEMYLSSADWMHRNLHKRIEVGFPIYDKEVFKELSMLLDLQLSDNTKARVLDQKLRHEYVQLGEKKVRSQLDFYNYLKEKESRE